MIINYFLYYIYHIINKRGGNVDKKYFFVFSQ